MYRIHLVFVCLVAAGSCCSLRTELAKRNNSEALATLLLSLNAAVARGPSQVSRKGEGSPRQLHRDAVRLMRLPTATSNIRACAHRAAAPCLAVGSTAALQLVTSYNGCVDLLLTEIANTKAGDKIDIGIYLLEDGESSEQILRALQKAGARSVHVEFRLDVSYVSMISRLIEKTDTLIPRVAHLAKTQPQWCSCTFGSKPDHSKFAVFTRHGGGNNDSAVLGGMNFGDRFQTWDDFCVRLPHPYAKDLCQQLRSRIISGRVDASSWLDDASTLDIARIIAIASPVVALFTLMTFSALVAIVAMVVPISVALSDPLFSYLPAIATIISSLIASILGATFATACDGAPFFLPREIRGIARSLVFDRSMLGDYLAPLRCLYQPQKSIARSDSSADSDLVSDGRYLQPLTLESETSVQFIANRRDERRYEIEPTFRALFSDKRMSHYRITMAYLGHRWGVELIELALRRGATVDLLLPSRSNVYACENLKSAQVLIDSRWPRLHLYLHPQMVHAKAMVAWDDISKLAFSFLGSANLVRGSMNLPVYCGLLPYDELNVLVSDSVFCNTLNKSMDELFGSARKVGSDENLLEESEWYSEGRAQWEELWQ